MKSWKLQTALVLLLSIFIFAFDYLFIKYRVGETYPRNLNNLSEVILLLGVAAFSFQAFGFTLFAGFVCLLEFLQVSHMAFYGTFVHPAKIWYFVTDLGEVNAAFPSLKDYLLIPHIFLASSALLLIFVFILFPNRPSKIPFTKYILIFLFVFPPIKIYFSETEFGKSPAPTNLGYVNLYQSISYFFGRIVPLKLKHEIKTDLAEKTPELSPAPRPDLNVILVLGESLRSSNMSLYGFEKPTTPYLDSLKNNSSFSFNQAVSSGVFTAVSVPLLLNNAYGIEGINSVHAQNNCLFKLAEQSGFETYFFSTQVADSLKHIVKFMCQENIGRYEISPNDRSGEDYPERFDDKLVTDLDKVNWKKNNFVVLQMRGSHVPFHLRYPKSFEKFPVNDDIELMPRKRNAYNNSILYTDFVFEEMFKKIQKLTDRPTWVIFTSDHGQVLGERGTWGHGFLGSPEVIAVPFFTKTFNTKETPKSRLKINQDQVYIHRDISEMVISLLGYNVNLEKPSSRVVTVMGGSLDGIDGWMQVSLTPKNFEIISVEGK